MEFNSIPSISFNSIHDFCSHPLISTLVVLYTLVLIYAPSFFLRVVLCPVLNSTGILLIFLLKLGANERSRSESSTQDIRNIDSSVDDKLEKDPSCLEPRFADHKDKHHEKSSNDGGNLTLCSIFGPESTYLEQKLIDLVDQNQANINLKAKVDLGFGSTQTDTRSNQMNIEGEQDLRLESDSLDEYNEPDLLYTNCMESSQVIDKGEITMEMDSMHVDTTMKFLEWDMKAPLEIIYEAYEGEEEEEDGDNIGNAIVYCDKLVPGCERYPSLSMCYSNTESESSSEDDYPVNEKWEAHESVFFKWEAEEDEREELIEISLDHYGKRRIEFGQDEEDTLIEIDIFTQEVE